MRNRQFITILAVVIIWFIYFWYRIDKMQRYITNIDNNVATIDERIVWYIKPQLESIYDKYIYGLNN